MTGQAALKNRCPIMSDADQVRRDISRRKKKGENGSVRNLEGWGSDLEGKACQVEGKP